MHCHKSYMIFQLSCTMAEIPRKFKWDGMGTPVAPGTPGTHGTFDFHKYSGAISGMD